MKNCCNLVAMCPHVLIFVLCLSLAIFWACVDHEEIPNLSNVALPYLHACKFWCNCSSTSRIIVTNHESINSTFTHLSFDLWINHSTIVCEPTTLLFASLPFPYTSFHWFFFAIFFNCFFLHNFQIFIWSDHARLVVVN